MRGVSPGGVVVVIFVFIISIAIDLSQPWTGAPVELGWGRRGGGQGEVAFELLHANL